MDEFTGMITERDYPAAGARLRAHVAMAPGRDFGTAETARFVRFSTANSMPNLEQAIARLASLHA